MYTVWFICRKLIQWMDWLEFQTKKNTWIRRDRFQMVVITFVETFIVRTISVLSEYDESESQPSMKPATRLIGPAYCLVAQQVQYANKVVCTCLKGFSWKIYVSIIHARCSHAVDSNHGKNCRSIIGRFDIKQHTVHNKQRTKISANRNKQT